MLGQNAHGFYCVPSESAHRPAARAALRGRVWEPESLDLLIDAARGGDVITAGVYFGDALPALARAAASGTAITAFEPNPTNFACASWTLRLNGITNVRLVNAALGAGAATVDLVVRDEAGNSLGGTSHVVGSVRPPHARPVGVGAKLRARIRRTPATTPMSVVAIDATVEPDRVVRMIHLDVEGYEEQALAGALGVIERWHPALLIETPPLDTSVWRTVEGFGYSLAQRVEANSLFIASGDPS